MAAAAPGEGCGCGVALGGLGFVPPGHHPQSKSPRHSGDSSAWQFLHPASGQGTGMLREGTHGAAGWGGSST